MASQGGDFSALPEGCIANILSFTSPRDACSLSMVSSIFKNAAQSDTVWERFLPPDYHSIISRSTDPNNSLIASSSSSKKQLFLSLCKNPILIDNGKKSFSIEKLSGKKCYMLSARDLSIIWGDTPNYWTWNSDPDSRFAEVAELIDVCWLEIRGKISTNLLSAATIYNAYLVFKLNARAYGLDFPAEATVGVGGSESNRRSVNLDVRPPDMVVHTGRRRRPGIIRRPRHPATIIGSSLQNPKERGDGWLEVELGEFFNKNGEYGELEICVAEVKRGNWKSGLIVHGIEIRPKEA